MLIYLGHPRLAFHSQSQEAALTEDHRRTEKRLHYMKATAASIMRDYSELRRHLFQRSRMTLTTAKSNNPPRRLPHSSSSRCLHTTSIFRKRKRAFRYSRAAVPTLRDFTNPFAGTFLSHWAHTFTTTRCNERCNEFFRRDGDGIW